MCFVSLDEAEVGWECHGVRGGWEGQGRLVMGKGRVAQLGCLSAIVGLMKT